MLRRPFFTGMNEQAAAQFSEVDWRSAWLAPFREVGSDLASQIANGAHVHDALNRDRQRLQVPAVGFVDQYELRPGQAYEQFIHDTGKVPTRDNLHDFFNGLIWQHYPRSKRRLNQIQARALREQGVGPVRGPLRDACTLFDESGAVLQAPDALWQALLVRDWHALFVTHRALWRQARLSVFGHAVLEQLVRPRKGITVHVMALPAPLAPTATFAQAEKLDALENVANIDGWLSTALHSDWMRTKPFTPLPLLGIPGWCSENADLSFYDDPAVFRPRRMVAQP